MGARDCGARGEVVPPGPPGRPEPGDDFYCLRFQVWYPSFDCAIRTRFRTSPSCERCDQGRFNLKRHAASLQGLRPPLLPG